MIYKYKGYYAFHSDLFNSEFVNDIGVYVNTISTILAMRVIQANSPLDKRVKIKLIILSVHLY